MKILSDLSNIESLKVSSIVKFCGKKDFSKDAVLRQLNKLLDGAVEKIYASGEFDGSLNQSVVLHTGSRLAADRVILAGLGGGKPDNEAYRQSAGTISTLNAIKSSDSAAFYLNDGEDGPMVSAIIEGFLLGHYTYNKYKSEQKKQESPRQLSFCTATKKEQRGFDKAITTGQIVAEGVILARQLATDPGNYLSPQIFAQTAGSMAKKYNFDLEVLTESEIKAEKMGALLAVAQGSANPPRLVVAKHPGGPKGSKPIVLVGKGITFDAGGISLKKPLDMDEMKGDMTGGGIVLSTIATVARLGLKQNIIGIVPLAENLPSGTAVKPGDIITSRKGLTIEILNTDAEGRLVLADALDYANEFNPKAVVDIATLTGAAKYILGDAGIPYISNNDKFAQLVNDASIQCGEKVWRLPIWDEHRRQMKSNIADLKNTAGPNAGTINASAFLEYFIGNWPWAHLDIAFVDIEKKGKPYIPKGQTANGMRLLVYLLTNWKNV